MSGLWLLPSRRRIEKLGKFFAAAVGAGMTTPGVVLVQKDELAELRVEYDALAIPPNWKILGTNGEGMADKCCEVWGAVKLQDWVGLACDDLRPQTPNWDQTLVSRMNGKNIVTCNDGQQGANRMAGITIFSGGVLRAMGYMYPQGFWHTWVDNVWEDIGRESGCWTYVDEVLIQHDHPFRNQKIDPELADETTHKSYGQSARDVAAYQQWVANEKAAVIARVKAIQ